jgi:hypothetical protein
MTNFMTLRCRRRCDENTEFSTAMRVRDRALVLINILLIFYCGNFGDENRLQIAKGQFHIQGYLHFYLHVPHSATMTQLFLHFFNPSLRIKKNNALCGDHVCLPVRLSLA